MRVEPENGTVVLIKRDIGEPGLPLYHVRTQKEAGHLEARKSVLIRYWICQYLDPGLPPELGEMNVCILRLLVYNILL